MLFLLLYVFLWIACVVGWLLPLAGVILCKVYKRSAKIPAVILAVWLLIACAVIVRDQLQSARFYQACPHPPRAGELQPFSDMYRVDRAKLGLTPLPSDWDEIRVEDAAVPSDHTEVFVTLYAPDQCREVSFERVKGRFRWTGECEYVYRKRLRRNEYETSGGELMICYNVYGDRYIPKGLHISCFGPDKKLASRHNLTSSDAARILKQWDKRNQAKTRG